MYVEVTTRIPFPDGTDVLNPEDPSAWIVAGVASAGAVVANTSTHAAVTDGTATVVFNIFEGSDSVPHLSASHGPQPLSDLLP